MHPAWQIYDRCILQRNGSALPFCSHIGLYSTPMKRFIPFIIVFALITAACSKNRAYEANEATGDTIYSSSNVATTDQAAANKTTPIRKDLYDGFDRNVIKKAQCRFSVKDVHKSTDAIEILIRKWPSYVETSSLTMDNQLLQNKMTIRIQNEYFGECLKAIEQQAVSIDSRDISTDNVSKEFVDLESRLRTKRQVEARYAEILRKKAATVEEVLLAEQQIGALQEDIEATVQRINYLKDQVGYSTIDIEFYQYITPENTIERQEKTFYQELVTGFATGWTALTKLILVLIYLWPLLAAGGLTLIILKFRKRKVAQRSAAS